MSGLRLAVLLASLTFVSAAGAACGGKRAPPPPPFQRIVVATLPFDNASASMDAPVELRRTLHPRLPRKGYLLQPLPETDEKLRAMGIQLGGQIKGVDPKELREKLGADLAVWGTVYTAGSVITGIYNRNTVEAEIVVTDLRSGEVIWKDRQKVWNDDSNKVGKGLGGLVSGVVEGVVRSDLTPLHGKISDVFVSRLPWCPRENPLPPPPPDGSPAAGAPPAPAPSPAPSK